MKSQEPGVSTKENTEPIPPDMAAILASLEAGQKRLERRLNWLVIGNYLRLILVLVPLLLVGIFAYNYLPQMLDNIMSQYQEAIGIDATTFESLFHVSDPK
jgi:hypothetical protein